MASDLMCSTPPGASPTTLSSSSLLSTLLQVNVLLIGGHGGPVRGKNQSRGGRWQSRGRGGARERTYDRGRGHYRGTRGERLGRVQVIGGGDIIEGGGGNAGP